MSFFEFVEVGGMKTLCVKWMLINFLLILV